MKTVPAKGAVFFVARSSSDTFGATSVSSGKNFCTNQFLGMHIPVTDSTFSAVHLCYFLQDKYGFGRESTCQIFRTGINHTYIVADEEKKYVFRIYSFDWRTQAEIQEEIRVLNLLKENDIAVSFPIPDKEQNYIQQLQAPEGLRFGVLFLYAPGKKVRNFSSDACYHIGILMARMHRVTENVQLQRIHYNADTLTTIPYQFAKKHFAESNEEMRFVKKAGECIASVFASAENLRSGAVHLDLWYDNMHINGDADATLFDFDFCGNGWLLHDIAYFIMQLFHIEHDKNEYEARITAFFQGYESVTLLTREEKTLLPFAGLSIWIFYLGIQSQRFDNWSNVFLSENYLKRYIAMVKEWLKYNKIEVA